MLFLTDHISELFDIEGRWGYSERRAAFNKVRAARCGRCRGRADKTATRFNPLRQPPRHRPPLEPEQEVVVRPTQRLPASAACSPASVSSLRAWFLRHSCERQIIMRLVQRRTHNTRNTQITPPSPRSLVSVRRQCYLRLFCVVGRQLHVSLPCQCPPWQLGSWAFPAPSCATNPNLALSLVRILVAFFPYLKITITESSASQNDKNNFFKDLHI